MFDILYSKLQKPEVYQKSSEPFWDDEHISKKMLEAHLNPDLEAASRKHDYIKKSTEWIRNMINPKCKILDLGCGPGLYTKLFSDMGFDVIGIDFSKRSIEYAKCTDKKSRYIYGNYLELDYLNKFDVITLIYCDYGALTVDDRKTLIEKVYRALKTGGMFILDVFTTEKYKVQSESTSWSVIENEGFWSGEQHIRLNARHFYENNIELNQAVVITADKISNHLIWNTFFTKETLVNEVMTAGFRSYSIYDDVCGKEFTANASTMCIVLEK